MEIFIYISIFFITSTITVILLSLLSGQKTIIKSRLDQIQQLQDNSSESNEFREPFWNRIIRPFYLNLLAGIATLTPNSLRKKYDYLIVTSGKSKNLTFTSLVFMQILLAFVIVGSVYVLYQNTGQDSSPLILFVLAVIGFFLPILLLKSTAKKRKDKIRRELPDLLDLIYISVEAGLGFDLSLKRSSDKMKGILSDEIKRMLSEILKGRDRVEALRGLEKRTGVEELTSFVTAIIQTEQLGTNIANMLRIQSETMRVKRRQHAEEKAAQMGIKMLFPLIFFIFPSLFVVILGPAFINIYETFISGF